MAAVGDHRLTVLDNVISDLVGSGAGGRTIGVLARDVGDVTVSRTSIVHIDNENNNWGELMGNPARGIVIEHTDAADVRANTLLEIHGGTAFLSRDGFWNGPGDAVGIELNGVTEATVVNNSLR